MLELSYESLLARAAALPIPEFSRVYGIPNGGIYAALLVKVRFPTITLVEAPEAADLFIDDIVDSGRTRSHWELKYQKPLYALVDKQSRDTTLNGTWVGFPWERVRREDGPQDAITRVLQYIGEDVMREGLRETPHRVIKSYSELFAGYKQDPKDVIKTFDDGVCDEMVVLKDMEFTSFCEHHMLPFTGRAHVAYIPDKKIIGVSKLARILDIYAKRLQVQERLTVQVTKALDEHLQPRGSACVLEAAHYCMICRGVEKQHSKMITSSLTGVFRQPEVRAEFFHLVRS